MPNKHPMRQLVEGIADQPAAVTDFKKAVSTGLTQRLWFTRDKCFLLPMGTEDDTDWKSLESQLGPAISDNSYAAIDEFDGQVTWLVQVVGGDWPSRIAEQLKNHPIIRKWAVDAERAGAEFDVAAAR